MARKKRTTKPFRATTTVPKSRDWFKKAYAAAAGGAGEGGGYESTGYTVDWSKVDFGKKAIEDRMTEIENKKRLGTTKGEHDPAIMRKKRKECADQGGTWNAKTGECDLPGEKKEVIIDEADKVKGCMDPTASNYNAAANAEDGTCTWNEGDINAKQWDADSNAYLELDDENIEGDKKRGCTDPNATNYDPEALVDDGSCTYEPIKEDPIKKDQLKEQKEDQQRIEANAPINLDEISDDVISQYAAEKNVTPTAIDGLNANDRLSVQIGGGNFKNVKQKLNKNKHVNKGKDTLGHEWNYSASFKGGKVTFDYDNFGTQKTGIRRQLETIPGFKAIANGKIQFTKKEWNTFIGNYNTVLKEAQDLRNAISYEKIKSIRPKSKQRNNIPLLISEWVKKVNPATGKNYTENEIVSKNMLYRAVLYLNARSFFNRPFGEETPTQYSVQPQETPFSYISPFPQRSKSHLKVRENWVPIEETPMGYSPFHQQDPMEAAKNPGSIWEKMKAYGKDIDKKIKRFTEHVRFDPTTDKPINAIQNQEWVGAITKWLQGQKTNMVKATNSKNRDAQQKISTAINVLIQDVTTYSGKFLDWLERNSGEQQEGSAGDSIVSLGSKKDEKFIGDTTFMGDMNTMVAVGDDGKLGIKSFGLPGVKYVEDLDIDVFPKDDAGHVLFLEASGQLQKDAESGRPINMGVVEGHADNLLKNEDSILSWAFDPLYGKSWIQDFVQANPDADVDKFMPESASFDIDLLTDELHGWLTAKLKQAYDQSVPQKPEQKGDAAQQIMDQTLASVEEEKGNKEGVYTEPGAQETQQAPPPMTYKSEKSRRALELINKYSRI